jgi:hypothetical protein
MKKKIVGPLFYHHYGALTPEIEIFWNYKYEINRNMM